MGEGRYTNQPAVCRKYQAGNGIVQALPVPEQCPPPNAQDGYSRRRQRRDNTSLAILMPLAALVERDRLLTQLSLSTSR